MSMQNPLARVRGKGSSGGGAHHWRSQRYSALILLLSTAWILWMGVSLAGADYAVASAVMSSPVNAGMAILMAGTVFYHTHLGFRRIQMHPMTKGQTNPSFVTTAICCQPVTGLPGRNLF